MTFFGDFFLFCEGKLKRPTTGIQIANLGRTPRRQGTGRGVCVAKAQIPTVFVRRDCKSAYCDVCASASGVANHQTLFFPALIRLCASITDESETMCCWPTTSVQHLQLDKDITRPNRCRRNKNAARREFLLFAEYLRWIQRG